MNETYKSYHETKYKKFYELFSKHGLDYQKDVGQKGDFLPYLLERYILLGNIQHIDVNFAGQLIEEIVYSLFELKLENQALKKQIADLKDIDKLLKYIDVLKAMD